VQVRDSFEGTGLLIDNFQFCTKIENIRKDMAYITPSYRVKAQYYGYS